MSYHYERGNYRIAIGPKGEGGFYLSCGRFKADHAHDHENLEEWHEESFSTLREAIQRVASIFAEEDSK